MARDGWFDGKGVDLLRDEFLVTHPGWKKYIADGEIDASEIEPKLDDAQHEMLTKTLLEYEVLVNMALVHYPSVMDSERYWSLDFCNLEED